MHGFIHDNMRERKEMKGNENKDVLLVPVCAEE
jgi:hypothetical protein